MEIGVAAGALIVSVAAIGLGIVNALAGVRQRSRQAAAAVTGELYPILRSLRDSGWQFAKPLGGQQNQELITFHNRIQDLADIAPAISDKRLRALVDELLAHDAAGIAMSIDPPRFMGMVLTDEALGKFTDFVRRRRMRSSAGRRFAEAWHEAGGGLTSQFTQRLA